MNKLNILFAIVVIIICGYVVFFMISNSTKGIETCNNAGFDGTWMTPHTVTVDGVIYVECWKNTMDSEGNFEKIRKYVELE